MATKKKNEFLLSDETIVGENLTDTPVKETPVVSDPFMAVQGAPVAPSKTFIASREARLIKLLVPVPFTQALLVYLSDYARCIHGEANGADIPTATISYEVIHAEVIEVFPADEVFASVLSMLERMEKIYLTEKDNR